MGLTGKLTEVTKACSEELLVPSEVGCCAFAGDRGFLFLELTASATQAQATQIRQQPCDAYCSSSKTWEIAMTRATGQILPVLSSLAGLRIEAGQFLRFNNREAAAYARRTSIPFSLSIC
jgi:hypothetical protein